MIAAPATIPEIVLIVLLAGWAAADTTAAFQFMTGQAFVVGWLAGLILGQPALGLFMGAALQLLWSFLTPVGAAAYPDVGPATTAGVAVSSLLLRGEPAWRASAGDLFPRGGVAVACLLGLLVAIVIGRLGQLLTVFQRRDNARLAHSADNWAARGSFAGVEWENAVGVFRSFGRGVMLVVLAVPAWLIVPPIHYAIRQHGSLARQPAEVIGPPGGPAWLTAANPGVIVFWWIGLAAIATVFWRGGRRDWGLLVGGALFGSIVWIIL